MPNHCYNRVDFYSDDTTMILKLHRMWKNGLENDELKEAVDTVFGQFIPEPNWETVPLHENDVKEYSFSNPRGEVGECPIWKDKGFGKGLYFESTDVNDDRWYNWRVHNWGTKWDCYDLSVHDDDLPHGFQVTFNTAWSPPEEIKHAIDEMFDDLSMTWFYDEPGCELAGYL